MPQIGLCHKNLPVLIFIDFGMGTQSDTEVGKADSGDLPGAALRIGGNVQLRQQTSTAARKCQRRACEQPALLQGETEGAWRPQRSQSVSNPAPQYLDEALHDLQGRFQHILLPSLQIRHLQAINWGHVGPRTYRNTRQVSTRNPQHPLPEPRVGRGICFFLSASRSQQHQALQSQNSLLQAAGTPQDSGKHLHSWLPLGECSGICQQPMTTINTSAQPWSTGGWEDERAGSRHKATTSCLQGDAGMEPG